MSHFWLFLYRGSNFEAAGAVADISLILKLNHQKQNYLAQMCETQGRHSKGREQQCNNNRNKKNILTNCAITTFFSDNKKIVFFCFFFYPIHLWRELGERQFRVRRERKKKKHLGFFFHWAAAFVSRNRSYKK